MPDAGAAIDPRALGKILLIQTTVHGIPTEEVLVDFVSRGLEGLPGARSAAIRIGDTVGAGNPQLAERVRTLTNGSEETAGADAGGLRTIGIGTLHQHYGSIILECDDAALIAAYEPFLRSLANTIALTLENRAHADALERLNRDLVKSKENLESVVRERTSDLVTMNEALARQIEDRTRYAQQVRESELRYRDLFENASDAILVLDTSLRYVDVNRQAEELFGYTRGEFLTLNFRDLDPYGTFSRATSDEERSGFSSAGRVSGQQRSKSGRLLDVEISSSPIVEHGAVTGYRHIVRDVTSHLALEKALRRSQKMEAIGTLSSGIAHDFNNILTAIICSSEVAQMQLEPGNQALGDLERIASASRRATDLVRQILAFSSPSREERRPVHLQPVLKEALKFLRASLPRGVEIVQDIDERAPMVLADPTQLHQVVMNLCTNGYHAMLGGEGILKVGLHFGDCAPPPDGEQQAGIDRPWILLEVADTGCGMDPAILDRIFDPYFTTKEKGKGTGLGLAVVHGIVRSLEGQIHVTSEVGKGSTFRIYLPALEAAAAVDESSLRPSFPRGAERVWVVDDEHSIALVEKNILETLGYSVRCFTSGTELLSAFEKHPEECDLVLSDVGMPQMNGAQLAARLLEVRSNLPVILCTGFSETLSRSQALSMGVRDYLMKPLDIARISAAVRTVLDAGDAGVTAGQDARPALARRPPS